VTDKLKAQGQGFGYSRFIEEAKRCGVYDELVRYLNREGDWAKPSSTGRIGLVATNFYVPFDALLAFQEAASKRWTEVDMAAMTRKPGFLELFSRWVLPRPMDGKRVNWRGAAAANGNETVQEAASITNGHAAKGTREPLPEVAYATADRKMHKLQEQTNEHLRRLADSVAEGNRLGSTPKNPVYTATVPTDEEGYADAKDIVMMSGWSFSRLSKLCCEGGPVRFRRPAGNRLEIHAKDFAKHIRKREEAEEAKA
jgi:hypothetical protein